MRAPTSAPSRLPSPPITTTTNARMSASTPMPSTAPEIGMSTAPPSPAMRQPRVKACTYTRLTLIPSAEAMRMSCDVAGHAHGLGARDQRQARAVDERAQPHGGERADHDD